MPGPSLRQARLKHGAVALDNHRALVIGGADDTEGRHRFKSTEILDLVTGTSVAGPPLAEGQYKLDGAVGALPDGRVLIGGGSRLEMYDPTTGHTHVVAFPRLEAMSFRTVTVLADGGALVAGGYDDEIVPTDAAITVPAAALAGWL